MRDIDAPRLQTRMLHMGRPVPTAEGARAVPVNPGIMRASTLLYADMATMREVHRRRAEGERVLSYGRHGTETAHALEDALTEMEGGYRTRLFPSGLAAIATAFLAFLAPGDHVLISDSVYGPVRKNICADILSRLQVTHDFIDPDGSDIRGKLKPRTRMIYAESPGSGVYEMSDLRELSTVAKSHGVTLVVDNTWASGYLHHPLALGADVSLIAGTKYIVGHSDVMLGAAVCSQSSWARMERTAHALGHVVSPDDAYAALRGLRTMPVRLAAHAAGAAEVAQWLQRRPEVAEVFYPLLPTHRGHDIWQRDFTGACGLISMELDRGYALEQAYAGAIGLQGLVDRFVDSLSLFGLGASWGGFESLVLPMNMAASRSVADWSRRGPILRFHIGLEHPADLLADLGHAFRSLGTAG